MTSTILNSGVELDARGIRVDGRPQILLCASLFYFRLPREEWAARLAQVRASGYTCIDVYLPWNFHETAPGQWSFEGRRDVAAFLDLAHDAGLYVLARPGPYICSEWDGGALPAWLGLDPQLGVRQHEPRFLAQVRSWFDQVLPLLAERQQPAGGPVIMVQLENELDFFDCADRGAYLTALRDQAVGHGITVPLIACAGQGDLAGATGDVAGVVPACNFYPNDDSAHIEPEVRRYADLLADRGRPLLVTETNRRHRTLRRLLAAGAKLIGPYLQSSGWNFGYTPSTGNWGEPGNLMSHGYDFAGYVSSTGTERGEFTEAQVLARVLDALGSRLAAATPAAPRASVNADFPTSSAPAALDLDGGGQLLALPNLGTVAGAAVLASSASGPVRVQVGADSAPLLLLDVPLAGWGVDVTLTLASADLVGVTRGDVGALALAFSSGVPVTVLLDGLTDVRVDGAGVDAGPVTVEIPAGDQPLRRVVEGTDRAGARTVISLVVLSPAEAARLSALHQDGRVDLAAPRPPASAAVTTEVHAARRRTPVLPAPATGGPYEQPPTLEQQGVYRGRGTYATTVDLNGVEELLVVGAADIVDLSIGGRALPSIARFGATERIDVRDAPGSVELHATVEIWGHPNFDDDRLPALRLGGLRGLGTVWTVTGVRDLSALWTVEGAEQWAGVPAPIRVLGKWSSTRVGVPVTYTRTLDTDPRVDTALHLDGLAAPVRASVDGGEPVTVHAENPWLLLPPGAARVSLTMPHDPSGPTVRAQLLTLQPVTGWSCAGQDDGALAALASDPSPAGEQITFPVPLQPGEEIWLDVEVPAAEHGYRIRLDGHQLRATAWAAGECLGRLWLADPQRPCFSGGDWDYLWLPGAWTAGGTRLTLLLRGTAGPVQPVLEALSLEPAVP